MLASMGFTEKQAREALDASNGDTHRAADSLLTRSRGLTSQTRDSHAIGGENKYVNVIVSILS